MIGVWIPLSQGKFALVDAADHEAVLARGKWSAHLIGGSFYAERKEQGKTVYLHRFILDSSEHTDHKNGDTLDCRRENLRPATRTQNNQNRRVNRRRSHGARFKGVYRRVDYRVEKWQAHINIDGRSISLGCFTKQEHAAAAYDRAAKVAHGEFARLNFPQEAA